MLLCVHTTVSSTSVIPAAPLILLPSLVSADRSISGALSKDVLLVKRRSLVIAEWGSIAVWVGLLDLGPRLLWWNNTVLVFSDFWFVIPKQTKKMAEKNKLF